jgi:hypothetical protein
MPHPPLLQPPPPPSAHLLQECHSLKASSHTLCSLAPFADPALLPPGQDSRLVGTTGLSYSAASREEFPSLNPPQQQPYLSNMAVDAKFRRWVGGWVGERTWCGAMQ